MSLDWNAAWRQQVLPTLADETWDLIVIGGGISGAGILREAARRGWRCLLLEPVSYTHLTLPTNREV